MTEVANPTLGKIEDAVQRFSLFALTEIGLKALFTYFTFLNVWPLKQIITGVTELLANKLFFLVRLVLDLNVIKLVNEKNQANFDRSVVILRVIAREQGIDSDSFKKGRENAKQNFSDLVRFNGA